MAYPVANPVGTQFVDIGDGRIDVPALFFLVHAGIGLKDDPYRKEIVHLTEIDPLGLHLLPDGIERFHPGTHLILDVHLVERLDHRFGEAPVDLVPLAGSLLHLLREFGVDFRMFILETELFQFGLDGKESQAVCKGGINI